MTDTQIRKGAHTVGNVPASKLPPPPSGPAAGAAKPVQPAQQSGDNKNVTFSK
jgi:hypothetical protein